MTGMVFRYGDHWHDPGEVNLVRMEVLPLYSARNQRIMTRYKMHIQGELIPTATEISAAGGDVAQAIATKVGTLIDVYKENNKFAGLYRASDTVGTNPGADKLTRHVLDPANGDNISGNRIEYRSWPRGAPDEFASVRTFYIIISADFLDLDSQILQYQETVSVEGVGAQVVGTPGAEYWKWAITWNKQFGSWQAVQQNVRPGTVQKIRQFGSITALTLYPVGNVPAPLFPNWEHTYLRRITYLAPQWQGQAHLKYPISWSYYMEAPQTAPSVTPTLLSI